MKSGKHFLCVCYVRKCVKNSWWSISCRLCVLVYKIKVFQIDWLRQRPWETRAGLGWEIKKALGDVTVSSGRTDVLNNPETIIGHSSKLPNDWLAKTKEKKKLKKGQIHGKTDHLGRFTNRRDAARNMVQIVDIGSGELFWWAIPGAVLGAVLGAILVTRSGDPCWWPVLVSRSGELFWWAVLVSSERDAWSGPQNRVNWK